MGLRFPSVRPSVVPLGNIMGLRVRKSELLPLLSRVPTAVEDLCERLLENPVTAAELTARNLGRRPVDARDKRAALSAWLLSKVEANGDWIDFQASVQKQTGASATGILLIGLLVQNLSYARPEEGVELRQDVALRLEQATARSMGLALASAAAGWAPVPSLPPRGAAQLLGSAPLSLAERALAAHFRFDALLPRLCFAPDELVGIMSRYLAHVRGGAQGRELAPVAPEAALTGLFGILWAARAGDGSLDVEKLRQIAGPFAGELVDALARGLSRPAPARPDYERMATIVGALVEAYGPEPARPLVDALVRSDALIPTKLAAVDVAKRFVPEGAMQGRGLVAQQHLFPTLVPMLEALFDKGLRPRDVFLTGKHYSFNPLVAVYLRMLGCTVLTPTRQTQGMNQVEGFRESDAAGLLLAAAASGVQPARGWTVLDDGGLLLRVADQALKNQDRSHTAMALQTLAAHIGHGVEQTTRGVIALAARPPAFPVTLIPKLEAKKREARVIAADLARGLLREARWRGVPLKDLRPAIIGVGTVGEQLASVLAHNHVPCRLYDASPQRRAELRAAGLVEVCETAKACLLGTNAAVLITGQRGVLDHELRAYRGLVMSGSSDANEVDEEFLVTAGATAQLANRGFPVNFALDGHETLSASEIGMTRALLFLGVALDGPNIPEAAATAVLDSWRASGHEQLALLDDQPANQLAAPDALSPTGRASHADWMTYLRCSSFMVSPAPTSEKRPGVFVFRGDNGALRIVDTRVGRSHPLPATIPARATFQPMAGESSADGMITFTDAHGARVTHAVKVGPQGVQLSPAVAVSGDAATRFDPPPLPPGLNGLGNLEVETWLSAQGITGIPRVGLRTNDGALVLFEPGAWLAPRRLPLPSTAPGFFVWPRGDVLLQVDAKPARVHRIDLASGRSVHDPRFDLPTEARRVLGSSAAYSPISGSTDELLLFEHHDGRQGVALVLPEGLKSYWLPAGATFKRLERQTPQEGGRLQLSYLPAGAPDELSHYQRVLL